MLCRPILAVVVAAGAVLVAGCGPAKLDVSKTYNLGPDNPTQGIELDPQSKPQTITVEFSSAPGEVTVIVVKKSDAKSVDDIAGAEGKAIAFKKGKSETFKADIPENTAVWVGIVSRGNDKNEVKINISNKK